MRSLLRRCPKCGAYTMKDGCPACGTPTVVAHPSKYSPDDKYARYRNPLAYQADSNYGLVDFVDQDRREAVYRI